MVTRTFYARQADGGTIDIDHPGNLAQWCKVLNASTDQLRQAVKAVGSRPSDVQLYVMKARLSDDERGPG